MTRPTRKEAKLGFAKVITADMLDPWQDETNYAILPEVITVQQRYIPEANNPETRVGSLDHCKPIRLVECNNDDETVEEGVTTVDSLMKAYGDVLAREEVERICRIVCDNFVDGEFRRAKLNEKLIEAAIEKSTNFDRGYDGGLEFRSYLLE